tara:strand:- start:273 stop:848 length:576 start_codon:yes stop_codon:yes gene_type:complete
MARRKISRKMPPLRQIQGIFEQGINNYDQANIDQNAAASFNQQFRTGSYNSTSGSGSKFDQGAMNAAGVNQNFGANNANVSQDRITGAITQNSGFQPTFLPNQRHWNQGATNETMLTPFNFGSPGKGLARQNAINAGKPMVESVNTFSSEIDPSDKSEFKNEVVNEVMNKVGGNEVAQSPQNKLEELYKPV